MHIPLQHPLQHVQSLIVSTQKEIPPAKKVGINYGGIQHRRFSVSLIQNSPNFVIVWQNYHDSINRIKRISHEKGLFTNIAFDGVNNLRFCLENIPYFLI